MSIFWYTKETMDKLDPDYLRFEHFSPVHLASVGLFIIIIIAAMLVYRKLSEGNRQKFLYAMAVLLILDEIWKHAFTVATGQWQCDYLPLHLCSINIFVCVWNSIKRDDISSEALYALCIPGAALALLMPTWTNLPFWNAMSLHSNSVHVLLELYPLLLLAGGFRPSYKRLGKVSLMLLIECVPIFFLNKLLDTNFFFLNETAGNPVLELLAEILGDGTYFLGLPVLLAFVWAAMYLPWYIIEKKNEKAKA